MKVGLILCKCFITYPNSISVLISFVFSHELLMSLRLDNSFIILKYNVFSDRACIYKQKDRTKTLAEFPDRISLDYGLGRTSSRSNYD